MKSLLAAAIALSVPAALAVVSLPSAPAAAPRVDFATTAIEGVPVATETIPLPVLRVAADRPAEEDVIALAPMHIVVERPTLATSSRVDEVVAMPPMAIVVERPRSATTTSVARTATSSHAATPAI